MCGIAGIFSRESINKFDVEVIKRMNFVQRHRGPDDEGLYAGKSCVLGHQRLSIIDLSKAGHQPFSSEDGRYQLVYNGEIYNYIELREELEQFGWQFLTKTDTEVLLKAYLQYGKECLHKFNGMFAFAIYDSKENSLFLARDRVGIKPLYYMFYDSDFYFSSEIKALRSIPLSMFSINYQALFDYMVFNRTDIFDETFFKEIKRIPKGHFAILDANSFKLTQWWDPEKYIQLKNDDSYQTMLNTIEEILVSSVKLRMRSDVPVGSCLSGGLDSTILIGILFENNEVDKNYLTFTSSFAGDPIDETKYIDILNKKYPFKNCRVFPSAKSAYDKLKDFVYTNDEPTTGPSFYSQYEVMRLAKEKGVKVLLDGQGGDENFAGYHYLHGFYLYGLLKKRKFLSFMNELLRISLRQQHKSAYQTLLFQILSDRRRKQLLLKTLPHIQPDFFYNYINSSRIYNEFFNVEDLNSSLVTHFKYKLEHLLRMEDRNSMAFSIEARVPYLDYRLIEYVLSISEHFKVKAGETKYLQKKAVGKYTVPEIFNRTDKIGFGTPGDKWMRMKIWQDITRDSYASSVKIFPDVFKEDFSLLPNTGQDYWKINQLVIWYNIEI